VRDDPWESAVEVFRVRVDRTIEWTFVTLQMMSEMIGLTESMETISEASSYSESARDTSQTKTAFPEAPEELLAKIRMMDGEHNALKDEVSELRTQLAESLENSKVLEKKVEDLITAFNAEYVLYIQTAWGDSPGMKTTKATCATSQWDVSQVSSYYQGSSHNAWEGSQKFPKYTRRIRTSHE
jgi:hypothetical protein